MTHCPHHATVLASWRTHWPHEDQDDYQTRRDTIARQCKECP